MDVFCAPVLMFKMNSFLQFNLRYIPIGVVALSLFSLTLSPRLHGRQLADEMSDAAQQLIASYEPKIGEELCYSFEDKSRENWHFFPNWSGRTGVPLYKLSQDQRVKVKQLLNLLLTSDAFEEYEKIRLIHGVKKDLDAPDNPRNLYFISIFGQPSMKASWAWRLEGHHLSLNCTLVDGKSFSVTPSFWGASPIRLAKNNHPGMNLFEEEQSLSLKLVKSLSNIQKNRSSLSEGHGPEAISRVSKKEFQDEPGIPFQELNKQQQDMLEKLIFLFANKYRPEIVQELDGRKKIIDPSTLKFAYVYSARGHIAYFRILSSAYLIEFDNHGGNHVHAAWRDFDGDFGRDLIRKHLKNNH